IPVRTRNSGTRTFTVSPSLESTTTRRNLGARGGSALLSAPAPVFPVALGDPPSLSRRRSASSVVIFPSANISSTCFRSVDMAPPVDGSEFATTTRRSTDAIQRFIDGDLAARQLLEHGGIGGRRLEALVECRADRVQAVLHGRVADVEQRFHLLDRAVMTDESDHEHLVFRRETGERRDLELAFERKTAVRADHPRDRHRLVAAGAASCRNIHVHLRE